MGFKAFLERKDIEFSVKRYVQDALSAMASGLFASLLIGLIIKTLGEQMLNISDASGVASVSAFMVEIGTLAMGLMGAAIGVAVAHSLKAPPLVLFASAITGMAGASFGGPAGSFVAAALGAEFGKAVSKETKVDIIVTPAVTLTAGMIFAKLVGPGVNALMVGLGKIVMNATELRPFMMGIIVAVVVGLALTAPISSAALCIMLNLSGIAAGAAVAGCAAQMVGFAVASYKENGVGGLVAQGLGTSMLQISNIVKHPWILVPATVASAVVGPISTSVFAMENIPVCAGMGTCGFVGQIGTFTAMGFSWNVLIMVLVTHIVVPAVVAFAVDRILRNAGKINFGDYKLDL